jgi:hypothetical protein
MGIIQLHKYYGSERLNKACERALHTEAVSYRSISNILKNGLDKVMLFDLDTDQDQSHIPKHGNIRGASAYE